jgi:hypothetical protein
MSARLCALRFVERVRQNKPGREPRDVSFVEELLPEGSVFAACGWKHVSGEEPYETEWVVWNVMVLSGVTLAPVEWWDLREQVGSALDMRGAERAGGENPCVADNRYEVCSEKTEAEQLSVWEAQVCQAIASGTEVAWTGSFVRMRSKLQTEQ